MALVFESDWLGTQPYFYNEHTGRASACIHEVIDYRALAFDADGLADYLDFGYCAFGHTPVRGVRFVLPCHGLHRDDQGRFHEVTRPDPVEQWQGRTSSVDDVLDRLRQEVCRWESSVQGTLTLPLSGGYDSRLIAALLQDKSRVRAFTYGVSRTQEKSREVARARWIAERLGVAWAQVPLGRFFDRLPEWDDTFGISVHAHGMYHMEFYAAVSERVGTPGPLASGLVGDAWAGSIAPLPARSAADLPLLGLSRGVHSNRRVSRLKSEGAYREAYWATHREAFRDPVFQIVEVIRQKMLLLSFALIVPANAGFTPWSPYLDPEIALAMTTLPAELRRRRRWQREFFSRMGLAVEGQVDGSGQNYLDLAAFETAPPMPLDLQLLREIVDEHHVAHINRLLFAGHGVARSWARLRSYPAVARCASTLRIGDPLLDALNAYVTLKPLEALIRRRNAA
ncbi:asparagine synthase-related protein [Opitutus sp. ER46]|uniref:asparagine synthase-related protein n=1 Tax=Opitutus sp. ER46 TaxID=2161864 RepID=UPI000D30AC4F|nr:asparagine synthase-related protein [Opitutus sp. ER46]PTX95549.1 hypothetical protein DB354_09000 [Opitutus sp. ER46]